MEQVTEEDFKKMIRGEKSDKFKTMEITPDTPKPELVYPVITPDTPPPKIKLLRNKRKKK
tara:strand:- start:44 stop:223 length:180 start_codon:yes stop_codon:yes gene_type:complete